MSWLTWPTRACRCWTSRSRPPRRSTQRTTPRRGRRRSPVTTASSSSSPEYNRGLPAALKNALDFLYVEWNNKAAGMVCYGSSGGLRAAEHLKSLLGELQIATVRAKVSISIFDDMRDFTVMTPRPFQADNIEAMATQVVRWAGAFRSLR